MARKPNPDVFEHQDKEPVIPDSVGEAANRMVQVSFEQQENAAELALQLRYDGPMHPDALESGIRDSQQRVSMELFNVGSRLLLLKEQCEYGEFMERLERLDIAPRMAQKFMQVSLKFANTPSTAHLQKLGKTKLIELLALDDEEVQELEFAGSVRGISLDAIDRMSCSDLRKQLREAKQLAEAKDKLITNKNTQIDELNTKLDGKSANLVEPDEYLQRSLTEVTTLTQQITTTLGTVFRKALVDISDHHALHGGDSDEITHAALFQMKKEILALEEAFPKTGEHDYQDFETGQPES